MLGLHLCITPAAGTQMLYGGFSLLSAQWLGLQENGLIQSDSSSNSLQNGSFLKSLAITSLKKNDEKLHILHTSPGPQCLVYTCA